MIEINNLCFSYTKKKPYILENINLNIKRVSIFLYLVLMVLVKVHY